MPSKRLPYAPSRALIKRAAAATRTLAYHRVGSSPRDISRSPFPSTVTKRDEKARSGGAKRVGHSGIHAPARSGGDVKYELPLQACRYPSNPSMCT